MAVRMTKSQLCRSLTKRKLQKRVRFYGEVGTEVRNTKFMLRIIILRIGNVSSPQAPSAMRLDIVTQQCLCPNLLLPTDCDMV